MSDSQHLLDIIHPYQVISIIGMMKNVGKTTVLNYIIKKLWNSHLLGLTSIGRDGELEDIVSCTPKPRIYVKKGTYLATAKECYYNCDITKEIIETSGIHTSMGEVIIVRALSDGYVELGGPSIVSYLSRITTNLKELGCDKILIDGAVSRKTFATPLISDATLLCTGAELSLDMNKVVRETRHIVNLFSLNHLKNQKLKRLIKSTLENSKLAIIFSNFSYKIINVKTSLDSAKLVSENLTEKVKYILIRGVLTDTFLEELMKTTDQYKDLVIIVEDATKLFIGEKTLKIFQRKGGNLRVINEINLIGIVLNPFSPSEGFKFDKYKFLKLAEKKINLPVFDIKLIEEAKIN